MLKWLKNLFKKKEKIKEWDEFFEKASPTEWPFPAVTKDFAPRKPTVSKATTRPKKATNEKSKRTPKARKVTKEKITTQ